MNISSEEDLKKLIQCWKKESEFLQQKNIRIASETIALNSMYYEQKGYRSGLVRMEKCLLILQDFQRELGS